MTQFFCPSESTESILAIVSAIKTFFPSPLSRLYSMNHQTFLINFQPLHLPNDSISASRIFSKIYPIYHSL